MSDQAIEYISPQVVKYIGYMAMVLIGISFLMKGIRILRILNMLGAAIFIVYGFLLTPPQPPIYILNSFILLVHLYYVFIKKPQKK